MRSSRVLLALALTVGAMGATSVPFGSVSASAAESALTISPSNPAIGAPLNLAVSGLPGGTVDFLVGTSPLGSANVNASGVASIVTSLWSNGTHTINATFRTYKEGVLSTTNFTGTVNVGVTTTSTPPSSTTIPPTTTTTTSVPNTTVSPYLADLPVTTGIGRVGETLTCEFLAGFRELKTVQWFDSLGSPIAGETATTYVVRANDVGGSVNCVVTNFQGSTGSIPLVIYNEAGALPTGSMSVTRQESASARTLSYTCLASVGSSSIVGYRFVKLVEFAKGSFAAIADSGLATVNQQLSCTVFVENRVGRVAFSAPADTTRKTLAQMVITGSGRVGRTLTCVPPAFSPARPALLAVEWTYENTPPSVGGFPVPTFVGPATYVVQRADVGRELRCRARFAGDVLSPFFQGLPTEFWVYSAPVLARR
jgi:hypothetical protein